MDLKELLGDELFTQVSTKVGDKKIAIVSDGQWIPKAKFDEVNNTKKELETQLSERDSQLTTLKKSAGDNDELKKQIQELQDANKKTADDYQVKIKDLSISNAIKLSINGLVHDGDLVSGLIDKSKIELLADGNVKGLDDQIKTLKESKGFLFKEAQQQQQFTGVTPADSNKQQHSGKIYTRAEIDSMSPTQINSDWANIQAQMEKGLIK